MKLKRILSGILAATVALTTMAITPFTTASAAETEYSWTGTFTRKVGVETTSITDGMSVQNNGSNYMTFAGVDLSEMTDPHIEVVYDANGGNDTVYVATSAWKDIVKSSSETTTTASLADYSSATSFIITTNNQSGTFGTITSVRFYDAAVPSVQIIASGDVSPTCSNAQFTLDSNGVLTISGTGMITAYDSNSYNWKDYNSQVKELVVEEGITDYQATSLDSCFSKFNNLEKVTFPTTITKIYGYTFSEYTNEPIEIYIKGKIESCSQPFGSSSSGKGNFYVYDIDSYNVINAGKGYSSDVKVFLLMEGDFNASGKCGDNAAYNIDSTTGTLTISGTGPMYENVTNTSGWEYGAYASYIKNVKVEEGITSIGNSAFRDLAIESAELSSTVTSISNNAFRGCASLTSIDFSTSVTSIGNTAFYGCASLTDVEFPSSVTSLGTSSMSDTFRNCTALKTITIKGEVEALGGRIFAGCTALEDIYIYSVNLSSVKAESLSTKTFDITNDPTFHIYKGSTTETTLTDAGYLSETNVEYLETAVDLASLISALVTAGNYKSENYTEESYKALTDAVEKGNEVRANENATQDEVDAAVAAINAAILNLAERTIYTGQCGDNVTWSFDKTTGILTISGTGPMNEYEYSTYDQWTYSKYADLIKEVVIQEGVTSVGACAFGHVSKINSTGVAYPNLTKITLPSTIEKIGTGAFYATVITNLTVPENVTSIGANAYFLSKIETVDLNEGVKIGAAAFRFCDSIKELTIPADALYNIGGTAWGAESWDTIHFADCTSLEKVTILGGGTVQERSTKTENGLSRRMFDECTSLKEVIVMCDDLAYVANAGTTDETFETSGTNITYTVYKNSTTEKTLRNAGYITDDNVVYFVDYTELAAKIAEAEAIEADNYTSESYAVLTAAISAANTVIENANATQDDVEAAIKNITDAIAALEYLSADYTAIDEAIASIPNGVTFTEESLAVLNKAVEAVIYDLDISHQAEVDAWAKAIEDAIAGLVPKPIGGTVTGTINVSDKDNGTEMTVTAVAADGTETSVTATSMGTYKLENLAVGDYTLTISGGKYAPRSYEITVTEGEIAQDVELNPYGDINGDGKVTTADVGMANSHAKGVQALEGYKFVCADVKIDGSITTADVGMINSHAKGVKALW